MLYLPTDFFTASPRRGFSVSRLSPELVHGVIRHRAGGRDILEAASQRVVVPDAGPIDPQRGVNRGLDILGIHIAVLRPAVNSRVRAGSVGLSHHRAALDAAARKKGELLHQVIAEPLCVS